MSKLIVWGKKLGPGEAASVVLTLASVAIAVVALFKANEVATQQSEAAAPILAPGTPPVERGRHISIFTEYAHVSKRADWLYLEKKAGRLVIPLRNGGLGLALIIGVPLLVADCEHEPKLLPEAAIRPPVGSYIIPSGGSDQLAFVEPHNAVAGHVPGQPQLWYSFGYKDFKEVADAQGPWSANLLIWYTDGAQRKLRWTCIQYRSLHSAGSVSEWGVLAQTYGKRSMVSFET